MTGRRDVRCAVIGAGMAGILAAIELGRAGVDDFTVFEKADRVGGTWRELTDNVPTTRGRRLGGPEELRATRRAGQRPAGGELRA